MKIIVEYDIDVEGKCDPEKELLNHLGIAGTPATDDYVILANTIEIKPNYEQLQAENDALKKENRWIPVSEGLPENIGLGYFVSNGIWIEQIWFLHSGWCYQAGEKYPYEDKITHWKPKILPKP